MTKFFFLTLLLGLSIAAFAGDEDVYSTRCLAEVRALNTEIRAHAKHVDAMKLDALDTAYWIKNLGSGLKGQSDRRVGTVGWTIYSSGETAEKNTLLFASRISEKEAAIETAMTAVEDCLFANL